MSILKPLDNQQGWLKAGFLGFPKSGKTHTAMLLAIGTRKAMKLKGPIGMFDTESGSNYIAEMVRKETGQALLGVRQRSYSFLGTLLFFSFPEILLLMSSELYTSLTTFSLLVCSYFFLKYEEGKEMPRYSWELFFAGIVAALSNHKAGIFPLALLTRTILGAPRTSGWGYGLRPILKHPLVHGFMGGSAVFWFYGLSIDYRIFWEDHCRHHVWNRIFHINSLGYGNYPSLVRLWLDFIQKYGLIFVAVALISMAYLLSTHARLRELRSKRCRSRF